MRVIVTLTINGTKETRLEGDCPIFDGQGDNGLRDLGFWLTEWKCAGHGGPNHKNKVFIPWTSVLYCEEVENASVR